MSAETVEELIRIHVATLFGCDADGRLRYVREPWGDPYAPPRFFMGRTLRGNVWHFRHDLHEKLTRELNALCRSEPVATDLTHPPRSLSAVRVALQACDQITKEERGPAYLIPETVQAPTEGVLITTENCHVLQTEFPWMLRHILSDIDIGPVTGVFARGSAISICYCARLSSSGAEAGVETLEAMRGRGYATTAVAAWAVAIRERGLLPLYSTSWENLGSQGVARRLGMVQYGEDWSIE